MMSFISIIAEIGSVHDGSFGNALKLIEAAAACGADAVKFQTHIAEAETLRDAPAPPYFTGEPRFEYFRRTGFSLEQWKRLAAQCTATNVTFLSSPFSLEAVDLLEEVGVAAYKVPSGEVTNSPLLERIAATGKPVLSLVRDELVGRARRRGRASARRPAHRAAVHVGVPQSARARRPQRPRRDARALRPAGRLLRPHAGIAAAIAAVALGATAIEKHFTSLAPCTAPTPPSRSSPRSSSSLRWHPRGRAMRSHPVDKDDVAPFREMKRIFEKSVVTALPAAGTRIEREHLAVKKPGDGIPAALWQQLLGHASARSPGRHKPPRPTSTERSRRD